MNQLIQMDLIFGPEIELPVFDMDLRLSSTEDSDEDKPLKPIIKKCNINKRILRDDCDVERRQKMLNRKRLRLDKDKAYRKCLKKLEELFGPDENCENVKLVRETLKMDVDKKRIINPIQSKQSTKEGQVKQLTNKNLYVKISLSELNINIADHFRRKTVYATEDSIKEMNLFCYDLIEDDTQTVIANVIKETYLLKAETSDIVISTDQEVVTVNTPVDYIDLTKDTEPTIISLQSDIKTEPTRIDEISNPNSRSPSIHEENRSRSTVIQVAPIQLIMNSKCEASQESNLNQLETTLPTAESFRNLSETNFLTSIKNENITVLLESQDKSVLQSKTAPIQSPTISESPDKRCNEYNNDNCKIQLGCAEVEVKREQIAASESIENVPIQSPTISATIPSQQSRSCTTSNLTSPVIGSTQTVSPIKFKFQPSLGYGTAPQAAPTVQSNVDTSSDGLISKVPNTVQHSEIGQKVDGIRNAVPIPPKDNMNSIREMIRDLYTIHCNGGTVPPPNVVCSTMQSSAAPSPQATQQQTYNNQMNNPRLSCRVDSNPPPLTALPLKSPPPYPIPQNDAIKQANYLTKNCPNLRSALQTQVGPNSRPISSQLAAPLTPNGLNRGQSTFQGQFPYPCCPTNKATRLMLWSHTDCAIALHSFVYQFSVYDNPNERLKWEAQTQQYISTFLAKSEVDVVINKYRTYMAQTINASVGAPIMYILMSINIPDFKIGTLLTEINKIIRQRYLVDIKGANICVLLYKLFKEHEQFQCHTLFTTKLWLSLCQAFEVIYSKSYYKNVTKIETAMTNAQYQQLCGQIQVYRAIVRNIKSQACAQQRARAQQRVQNGGAQKIVSRGANQSGLVTNAQYCKKSPSLLQNNTNNFKPIVTSGNLNTIEKSNVPIAKQDQIRPNIPSVNYLQNSAAIKKIDSLRNVRKNDSSATAQKINNSSITVKKNDSSTVKENDSSTVKKNDSSTVKENDSSTVKENDSSATVKIVNQTGGLSRKVTTAPTPNTDNLNYVGSSPTHFNLPVISIGQDGQVSVSKPSTDYSAVIVTSSGICAASSNKRNDSDENLPPKKRAKQSNANDSQLLTNDRQVEESAHAPKSTTSVRGAIGEPAMPRSMPLLTPDLPLESDTFKANCSTILNRSFAESEDENRLVIDENPTIDDCMDVDDDVMIIDDKIEVIDLTFLDDLEEEEINEVIESVNIKMEDDKTDLKKAEWKEDASVLDPKEKPIVMPNTQKYKRPCLCGDVAKFVCECNIAIYCGKDCQNKDWPSHRNVCKK